MRVPCGAVTTKVFGDPENSAKVMKEMKLQIEIGMGLCRM
jgi:hypothetical protein